MRRRTPPSGDPRPELTLIEGGLSADEVEDRVATTKRGGRWPHPAGRDFDPDGPDAG